MKTIKQTLMTLCLGLSLVGCTLTGSEPEKETESNGDKAVGQILQSLTPQQQMTLLAMLQSYDSNQEAIEAWQNSRESVNRLVELESDLKLLIMQLNSLTEEAQKPEPVAESTEPAEPELATQTRSQVQDRRVEDTATNTTEQPAQEVQLAQGFSMQLTAVNSLLHLRTYWQQIKQQHPVMFAEATPFYQTVDMPNGTTLFRLKVGKFATKGEAISVCREFVNAGGSCFATDNIDGLILE